MTNSTRSEFGYMTAEEKKELAKELKKDFSSYASNPVAAFSKIYDTKPDEMIHMIRKTADLAEMRNFHEERLLPEDKESVNSAIEVALSLIGSYAAAYSNLLIIIVSALDVCTEEQQKIVMDTMIKMMGSSFDAFASRIDEEVPESNRHDDLLALVSGYFAGIVHTEMSSAMKKLSESFAEIINNMKKEEQ